MNGRFDHTTTTICFSLRWWGGLRVVRLPADLGTERNTPVIPNWFQHCMCFRIITSPLHSNLLQTLKTESFISQEFFAKRTLVLGQTYPTTEGKKKQFLSSPANSHWSLVLQIHIDWGSFYMNWIHKIIFIISLFKWSPMIVILW